MEEQKKKQGNLRNLANTLVVGLGRSGRALGNHLQKKGRSFWIYDDKGPNAFQELRARWPLAKWWNPSDAKVSELGAVLTSPGVPSHHPVLEAAHAQGVPIAAELEFAWQESRIPLIAVTGTNGKSTTVALVEHFLQHAGYRAKACGNFGTPLLEVLDQEADSDTRVWDALVVEVSSFQAETSPTFKPRYAALLNVTPDHLDRYASMEAYTAAKLKMIARQDRGDFLIYNAEDPAFFATARQSPATVLPFSSAKSLKRGAYLDGNAVIIAITAQQERISLVGNPLIGLHHLENILAAALLARVFGVPAQTIENALPSFKGLPHRTERVAEKDGVVFYDDSKATNIGALAMSLASFPDKVILIAGGRDKGSDFSTLSALVAAKVARAVLIGEASDKMIEAWGKRIPISRAENMVEAVKRAYAAASVSKRPVVLSPACASFDQFTDYKHRGDVFQQAVRDL